MRRAIILIVVIALSALLPANLLAQAPSDGRPVLTLTAPVGGDLGETMTLTATLRDAAGAPLPDEALRLLQPAAFLRESGDVEVARAVTDASGAATFRYEPRESGEITLRAVHDASPAAGAVVVRLQTAITGDRQLVIVDVGTDAINFEFWGVVATLSIVWLVVLTVTLRIYAIVRASEEPAPDRDTVPRHFRRREEWPA